MCIFKSYCDITRGYPSLIHRMSAQSPLQTSQLHRCSVWSGPRAPRGRRLEAHPAISWLKLGTCLVKVRQGLSISIHLQTTFWVEIYIGFPSRNHFCTIFQVESVLSTASSRKGCRQFRINGLGPNVSGWLLVKSHYLQVQHGSLG